MSAQPVVSLRDAKSLDPGEERALECQSCRYRKSMTTNRARAAGWRVYDGPSLTGGALTVVLCDDCVAGRVPEFRAECLTCGADSNDDGTGPLSERDAKAWKFDHECEPEVDIVRVSKESDAPNR